MIPDLYDLRARIAPAVLAAFPPALSLVAVVPELSGLWKATSGTLAAAGGTYALAQFVRQRGTKAEAALFRSWGGMPSTQLLRYRGPATGAEIEHRHRQLRKVYPDLMLPTASEEAADPEGADQVYTVAGRRLREATRDRKRFPLVFKENCAYGFCRNAFGLWPFGFYGALGSASALIGGLGAAYFDGARLPVAAVAALGFDLLGAVFWGMVTSEWVRVPAFAYAARLLGAADQLP